MTTARPSPSDSLWSKQVHASVLYRRAQASPTFWAEQEERYRLSLAHNDYVERVLAVLDPKLRATDRILDVGGGSGVLALPLAQKVRWLTVVEPSLALCHELLDAAVAAGRSNIAVLPAPLASLPEGFSFVESSIIAHAFETVPEPHELLHKLFRCSRRNLLLIVRSGDPHPLQQEVWRRFRNADYPASPGLPAMLALLTEVGFRPVVETFTTTDNLVYRSLDDAVEQWTEELSVDGGEVDRRELRRFLQVWLARLETSGGPPTDDEPLMGVRSMTARSIITCWPGE
jgi:ubiquinone/menaquinone biosynthesis C-methylase UbiE